MIRSLLTLAAVALPLVLDVRALGAQAFDEKHACYESAAKFAGIAGGNQAWGDAAKLSAYVAKVRAEIWELAAVLALADAGLDKQPMVEQKAWLEEMRQFVDCIDWLGALLTRLESRLRDLGVNNLMVPGEREHVLREKYFRDVRAELAKGITKAKEILARRR